MTFDPDATFNIAAVAAAVYAGWKSSRADRQTRSTGNGFAKSVRDSLNRIEGKIDRHIEDHAEADLRRRQ